MECVGRLAGASRSLDGKSLVLTFEVDRAAERQIEDIRNHDRIAIKAVKYRQKRSLDANAYAWVLMSKIGDAIGSSKDDVYEDFLQKYGPCYEDDNGHIVVALRKDIDVSRLGGHWKRYKEAGNCIYYLMLKGSSEYDSAEMSRFLDRIIEDAQALGIETRTPDEITRMKQEWGT